MFATLATRQEGKKKCHEERGEGVEDEVRSIVSDFFSKATISRLFKLINSLFSARSFPPTAPPLPFTPMH